MRARLGILGEPKTFLLVKTLKLKDANMVSTPGEDPQEESELLEGDKISANRQLAERANYMVQGPAGHTVCSERTVHGDGNANSGSMEAFEKIGAMCSSASKKERASWLGGLPPNGRSTSGGLLMIGNHMLKSWSSTQRNVTLSSAEAELVAAVKLCGDCIGFTQLAADWRKPSAAAIGIANRKGNGKLHHVRSACRSQWWRRRSCCGKSSERTTQYSDI